MRWSSIATIYDSRPFQFQGSWLQLYRQYIEPNLPPVPLVGRCHSWMKRYSQEETAVFPVRYVRGTERRKIYLTSDGTQIAPSDNSPARVLHALLLSGRITSYEDFKWAI